MNSSRQFPATFDGLRDAAAFLDEICPNPRISVVFDELGSNVVRCSGATFFHIDLVSGGGMPLRMVITDNGSAFDPTKTPDPDVTASVEDREIGGLGLLMVKKMTKSFSYRREGDRNIVELTF